VPVSPRIALATCEELPDLDPDDQPLVGLFHKMGIEATPAIWSDPIINWAAFDHIIVRNTWDYTNRLEEFLAWAKMHESRIHNSYEILVWNSNKIYLKDLSDAGFPIVDTQFVTDPLSDWEVPPLGDFVVKPTVSAGSQDTMRFRTSDLDSHDRAQDLMTRIISRGKTAMVQPYLVTVDEIGETAQLFIGGEYSHAIRKGPLLVPNVEGIKEHGLFLKEDISPRDPRPEQRELAAAVIDHISQRFGVPLYARVDLLDDSEDKPVILEIELVEPSMFFATAPESAARLAHQFRNQPPICN
jgi:glutathione synthase/RimK-type ligase-like ATP-grasp enzyme